MQIEAYKEGVASLLRKLPEHSDPEWLLAVYLSLGTAERLGYKHDEFARKERSERDLVNIQMLSAPYFSLPASTNKWLAGHFFNNALFRMVALAEITLNDLFQRKMNLDPPRNGYGWLVDWYGITCAGTLEYMNKARARVNKFKHHERQRAKAKPLETYDDGLRAFEELLTLMRQLVEAEQRVPADGPASRARG